MTFIICDPLDGGDNLLITRVLGKNGGEERMRGDVNLFLYPAQAEMEENEVKEAEGMRWLMGEVDVMVADASHRSRGMGRAAVRALLTYLQRHLEAILGEYMELCRGQGGGGEKSKQAVGEQAMLRGLMAKIQTGNIASRALFEGLGFRQRGSVNHFGELTLVLDWDEAERRIRAGGWPLPDSLAADGYRELAYHST